jgi:hypothetical protein
MTCSRALLVIVALCRAPWALAQPTIEGSVIGHVKDEHGNPMEAVTVGMVGPAVAGTRQTITDAAGLYRFADLPPGAYTLTATRAGFATLVLQNISIRAGLNLTVDAVMKVSPIAATVEVTADASMLDTATPVHGVNISGDLQARLPLAAKRDWADFLLVTPGVVSNDGGLFYVHGSDLGSHVMQLDGVDLAATLQNATLYIRMNTDSLEDVQAKTAGIEASTPLGAGAVISLASRSGTNSVTGTGAISIRSRRWNANNNPGGTSSGSSLIQPDFALGGPIQRDRWWVFGSYRYLHDSQEISRTADQIATLKALAPAFQPFANEVVAHISFVKITGQLASRHQLSGFHQYDRTPSDTNIALYAQPLSRSFLGGSVYAARLSSMWGSWLTRLVGSFNDKTNESSATGTGPTQVIHRSVFVSSGGLAGTGPIAFLGNQASSNRSPYHTWTGSGDASHYEPGWIGTHELRAGVSFQHRHEESIREYSNGGFAQEQLVLRDPANPSGGAVPFNRVRFDPANLTIVQGRGNDLALYFQDLWRVTPRTTVSAGVRADVIRRSDRLFDVTTQRSTEWGPRVGANHLLTTDGRNVVRGSWGQIHDALSTNTILVGDDTAATHNTFDTDLDGVFETAFDTPRITNLANTLVLDPGRSQPYVNEWTIGYGRQLPWRIAADATIVRREYRNRTAFVPANGTYDNGVFRGYRNPDVSEIYQVTGNVWNWPVYSGLEFTATRQAGRLQGIAAYTRSFQHLAGTWQPNDAASFIQPSAFPNDRGIGGVRGTSILDANSLTGFAIGGPQWRRHILRTGLSYSAPWRFHLATTYGFQSGVWSGPVVTRISAPDARFGPPTVQLANGRVVENPLATTIRFAFATRGDGQFTLPGIHTWNIRGGYEFDVPGRRSRIEVLADVFNVLNLGAFQGFLFGGNQLYSPNFAQGTNRQLPRSAVVAIRTSF